MALYWSSAWITSGATEAEKLEQTVKCYKELAEAKTVQNLELGRQVAELGRRVEELDRLVEEQNQQIKDLSATAAKTKQDLELGRRFDELNRLVEEKDLSIKALEVKDETSSRRYNILSAKYQLSVSEAVAARKVLTGWKGLQAAETAHLRAQAAAEVAPLRQQLATLTAQVAALEPLQQQLAELTAKGAEMVSLRQEAAQVVQLRVRVEELTAEVAPLRKQAAEVEPLRQRLAAAAERQQEGEKALRKQIDEAESKLKAVKADLGLSYRNQMKQTLDAQAKYAALCSPKADPSDLRKVQPAVDRLVLAVEDKLLELYTQITSLEKQLEAAKSPAASSLPSSP